MNKNNLRSISYFGIVIIIVYAIYKYIQYKENQYSVLEKFTQNIPLDQWEKDELNKINEIYKIYDQQNKIEAAKKVQQKLQRDQTRDIVWTIIGVGLNAAIPIPGLAYGIREGGKYLDKQVNG